jgi:hypothetical protein
MDGLIAQIQRLWPTRHWWISFRDGVFEASIAVGSTFGRGESRASPEEALDQAFRAALHQEYESSK